MTREIITLQFGNYANYIGTHWWNIQESTFSYDPQSGPTEINHDVLYREGLNLNRQTTYTPRLLLVDLNGALKHLPRDGELYGHNLKRTSDADNEAVKKLKADLAWQQSDVEVIEQPAVEKNDFQKDLEDPDINVQEQNYAFSQSVDSWVDYAYARFHPRTVHLVQQYKHDNNKQTFDTYTNGVQLWHTEQFEDEFCNNIRQYVEECDYLQGFQSLFDGFNGFSGLATQCLLHLNDEYTKSNLAIPVYMPRSVLAENADEAMSDSIRVANSLLTFNALIEQATLFVPLSTTQRVWRQLGEASDFPKLQYQTDNLYQSSAILASYLDTISLRYRLQQATNSTLSGFCNDMNNYGRKMAAAGLALPFNMPVEQDLIDCLDGLNAPLFTSLTPNCKLGDAYVVQSVCVRGIPQARLKQPMEKAQRQMRMAAYKCNSVSEMFQLYFQCSYHNSLSHVLATPLALPTSVPFPSDIFDKKLNINGFMGISPRRETEKLLSVPSLAVCQNSNELGDMLETLHREAKRIKINKLHRFKSAGLEEDDYAEALENLLQFKYNYEDQLEL